MERQELENIIAQLETLNASFRDVLSREPIGDDGRLEKLSSITFKILGQGAEKLEQQMRKHLENCFEKERDPDQDQAFRKALGLD